MTVSRYGIAPYCWILLEVLLTFRGWGPGKLVNEWKLLSLIQLFKTPIDYTNPWNSPGQNTGVSSHSPLQGIFPIQWSNPCLPPCRWILYQLSHQGSPRLPVKHGNLSYMKIFFVSFISFKCPQYRWKTCVCVYIYIYIYIWSVYIWTTTLHMNTKCFFWFFKNLIFKWRKITMLHWFLPYNNANQP